MLMLIMSLFYYNVNIVCIIILIFLMSLCFYIVYVYYEWMFLKCMFYNGFMNVCWINLIKLMLIICIWYILLLSVYVLLVNG